MVENRTINFCNCKLIVARVSVLSTYVIGSLFYSVIQQRAKSDYHMVVRISGENADF